MKRSILLILLVLPISINIRAQSVGPATVNASGGGAVIGASQFDWSVEEMTMVSTFTTSGIIVTQGVLQPYEVPPSIVVSTRLMQQLQVYPNPASSVVNIQHSSVADGSMTCRLMDMAGRLIQKRSTDIAKGITRESIDISMLANASYMLEVTVNSGDAQETNSFKIQKIK